MTRINDTNWWHEWHTCAFVLFVIFQFCTFCLKKFIEDWSDVKVRCGSSFTFHLFYDFWALLSIRKDYTQLTQIINQWKYTFGSTKNLKIKRNISVPIYDIYRQVLVPIYPTYIYMLYIYLIHIFIVRCHVQKILTQITQPSHYIIYNIL